MPLQSFAMFGGVYAFASCIAQRIRQKQDGKLTQPATYTTGFLQ